MSVSVKIEGAERVNGIFDALIKAGSDLAPLMNNIGAHMKKSTTYRISDSKMSPAGNIWAPLRSDKYAAWKKSEGKNGLLELEENLRKSLTFKGRSNSAEWGTNVKYAARQQFGGKGVIARPFLGISAKDESVIYQLVQEHLNVTS